MLGASVTPPAQLPACQAHSKHAQRRLVDGGYLAVLDAFGTCVDATRVGAPVLLAPELVQARAGAALTYTPASDMWCAGAWIIVDNKDSHVCGIACTCTVKQRHSCVGHSIHLHA